jgi:hypothetical protein
VFLSDMVTAVDNKENGEEENCFVTDKSQSFMPMAVANLWVPQSVL